MKSHSIEWTEIDRAGKAVSLIPVRRLDAILGLAGKALLALFPALAIVTIAAWLAADPALALYLQATLWAGSFVFFGLAFEAKRSTVALLIGTGFALPVLALLSAGGAAELLILAAALVAGWVAYFILRR